jgi:hypothetical protein
MRRPRPSAMSLTIWSLKQKQGSKVKGVGAAIDARRELAKIASVSHQAARMLSW